MFPDVAMLKVVQITPPQELLVKIDQAVAELRGLQRKVHTIQTAAQTAVGALIAALTESKMAQVEAALLFALGMDRTMR